MAVLYLHIGTSKTGTTAIQQFMARNPEFLASQGCAYPIFEEKYNQTEKVRNAHFLATRNYSNEITEKNLDIIAELARKYDKIVISDESIYVAVMIGSLWKLLKKQLDERGIELKVVVYFRRQDEYLYSYYAQKIKGFKFIRCTYRDYLARKLDFLSQNDYFKAVSFIEEQLGEGSVIPRVFEKDAFEDGKGTVVSDFLCAIGLDPHAPGAPPMGDMFNNSVGDSVQELKRYMNQVRIFKKRTSNLIRFQERLTKQLEEEGRLGKRTGNVPAIRRMILKKYGPSNEKLAKKYFGRDRLFMDDEVEKGDMPARFTVEEMRYDADNFCRIYAEAPDKEYTVEEVKGICDEAIARFERDQTLTGYLMGRAKYLAHRFGADPARRHLENDERRLREAREGLV